MVEDKLVEEEVGMSVEVGDDVSIIKLGVLDEGGGGGECVVCIDEEEEEDNIKEDSDLFFFIAL